MSHPRRQGLFGRDAEQNTGTGRDACGVQSLAEQVFRRDAGNCTEDACAPQILAQTASAENYCDPQNLYLPMLLEISFQR